VQSCSLQVGVVVMETSNLVLVARQFQQVQVREVLEIGFSARQLATYLFEAFPIAVVATSSARQLEHLTWQDFPPIDFVDDFVVVVLQGISPVLHLEGCSVASKSPPPRHPWEYL